MGDARDCGEQQEKRKGDGQGRGRRVTHGLLRLCLDRSLEDGECGSWCMCLYI